MVTKTNPKKTKCDKETWLPEEVLKTAEKIELKGKGERERYTQKNADFQRKTRRVKKVFISEQGKNWRKIIEL